MTDADRITALEYRVAALEEALGLTYQPPPALGLTRFEARIVGMLMKANVATTERMFTALYGEREDPPISKNVDVFISRARPKLAKRGVEIRNTWGVGYWIPAEQKARLLDA